jgi:hypothetical protein
MADAVDSKSTERKFMGVRPSPRAPWKIEGLRYRGLACIFLDRNLKVRYIAADFWLRMAWEASEG